MSKGEGEDGHSLLPTTAAGSPPIVLPSMEEGRRCREASSLAQSVADKSLVEISWTIPELVLDRRMLFSAGRKHKLSFYETKPEGTGYSSVFITFLNKRVKG